MQFECTDGFFKLFQCFMCQQNLYKDILRKKQPRPSREVSLGCFFIFENLFFGKYSYPVSFTQNEAIGFFPGLLRYGYTVPLTVRTTEPGVVVTAPVAGSRV